MRNSFFILILFLSTAIVQPLSVFSQDIKFSHINSQHGLSAASVNSIIKDSKGFMWFGTQEGLNKYDGVNMTVYRHNPDDDHSISNNFIYNLFEDDYGIIWVCTNGGGLDKLDTKTGKFSHFRNDANNKNSISNNIVRCITKDKDGVYWVGTDNGLNYFDGKTNKFTRFYKDNTDPNSLSSNEIRVIHVGKNSTIWLGTYGGGLCLLNKRTKKFTACITTAKEGELSSDGSNKIRAIYEDADEIMLIGTDGNGLIRFDMKSKITLEYFKHTETDANSISNNRITSIAKDDRGVIWIGTLGGGISEYYEKTKMFTNHLKKENPPFGLSDNLVRCIFLDGSESIWVGTSAGGVNVHFRNAEKFIHIEKSENLPAGQAGAENSLKSNNICSIIQDYDGLLWLGTLGGGLSTIDRKTGLISHYNSLSTSTNNSVLSLLQDSDSIIWVGTWGEGFNSFNKKTGEIKFHHDNYKDKKSPLASGTILSLFEDTRGLIWVGTFGGGLYAYDKKNDTYISYSTANGLSSNTITRVVEDSRGILWIATDGGGVNSLDYSSGKIIIYKNIEKTNSISSNTVYAMYEDKQENIWFGTANGLNKFDVKTKKFTSYYLKDGLPNESIWGLLGDEKGNLWMSTNKGITRFNPYVENMEGSAFRSYDSYDGVQGDEFIQGSFFKNPATGEMFFGGLNGFNAFYPSYIIDNQHIPPIYIISYKRFGKEVALDTNITDKKYIELSYRDNFFSFEFVSLDYLFPEKNKYSWKMEGVDETWSPPSTRKYANYTNLSGGDYVFRVRSSNNDDVWNEEGAVLHIRINPPFWKTNLFYVLCVLFSGGAVFGFIRLRMRKMKKEKKILETKVAERTAELAQKNKDITSSIQYAKRIQEATLPPKELIQKHFPNSFIVYKPKDIVSGDFYWFGEKRGRKIIAVVDCTGHGVPGAFMSMIGHNLLNQIVIENEIVEPAAILNALNSGVQNVLKQGTHEIETTDGMDVVLCSINFEKKEIQFAGAYRPLIIISNGKFEKIDGNKFPIGGTQMDKDRIFKNHTKFYNKGDCIYMFSDGYADQFGGEKGKKFMVKKLYEILLQNHKLPMNEQGKLLHDAVEQWKGSHQQVDDILVVGMTM